MKTSRREAALLLRNAASLYFTSKLWAVNYEVGLSKQAHLRADLLALNMKGEIVIVEIKSCVADFQSDRKWHLYPKYCNKFYFCVGPKTWAKLKGRIPKGIGVMCLHHGYRPTHQGRGLGPYVKVVQSATRHDVDQNQQKTLYLRMAYRAADAVRYQRKSKVVYEDHSQKHG